MKADLSRIRFNPAKLYTAVVEQQGRVSLDADGNERTAIDSYLRTTTNVDVIGEFGGPIGDAGFEIRVVGGEILIGRGRYYVNGLLVENGSEVHFNDQPYWIGGAVSAQELLEEVLRSEGQQAAQFRLQVWQRLVTALDDGCLREPALGPAADTTARLQTVWRVVGTISDVESSPSESSPSGTNQVGTNQAGKITQGSPLVEQHDLVFQKGPLAQSAGTYADPVDQLSTCCQAMYGGPGLYRRTGAMGADPGQGNTDCGCQPIAGAGYQGLENQLYRVEIHTGGDLTSATFKWSRENGSVVTAITAISGAVVTATSLGPDANLGFQAGQWVELSDDSYIFGDIPNQPGQLYQIASMGPGPLQVTLTTSVTGIDTRLNARMRRWEQTGTGATAQGVAVANTPIQLENGIEVTFRAGLYVAGDYWTIPARTASGTIDWPPCEGNGKFFQAAQYTEIYVAPLACIHLRDRDEKVSAGTESGRFVVEDCRLLFPPLTALTQEPVPAALHVSNVSWANDDVMTVDQFLQQGMFVNFDQAPTCAWGGGNFSVMLEVPLTPDPLIVFDGNVPGYPPKPTFPLGTDVFLRTVVALDPPLGITTSGTQVNWMMPAVLQGAALYEPYFLYYKLNTMLQALTPIGYGRMRVRLIGSAIYAAGANGNLYLDGQSFGETGTRAADQSACVSLSTPSGSSLAASDYESWFYLAPSVVISGIAIQLLDGTTVVGGNAVTVTVNLNNQMTGLETTSVNTPTTVTAVQAVITMSYAVVAQTTVNLSLSGPGVGSVVTVQATGTVNMGQSSVTVPITIFNTPGVGPAGGGLTDTVSLSASVAGLMAAIPWGGALPTLAITGQVPTQPPPK